MILCAIGTRWFTCSSIVSITVHSSQRPYGKEMPTSSRPPRKFFVSENNVGILSWELVCAVERTDNEALHDALIDLLKAAKLQEGLRQVIVENGDSYNIKFYRKLLKVIDEEGLLRYSSVRRAVQTWCGLGYEQIEDKDIATVFHAICRYLEHPEEARCRLCGPKPAGGLRCRFTLPEESMRKWPLPSRITPRE